MEHFSEEKKKDGILPVFLWIFLAAAVVVLLILVLTLLDRNGTLDRWKARYTAWKEEKTVKKCAETAGEKTVHYFGPSGVADYENWFSGAWKEGLLTEEETGETKDAETETRESDPLRQALTGSPVKGGETWWDEVTKVTEPVVLYAQAETPLYGNPEKTGTIYGYGRAGEEFRLFGVFENGWYVVSDGRYYYCSEGNRYTMVKPSAFSIEEAKMTVESEKVFHEVDTILQKPELPHGCEVTGLAILLSYYGINADKCELADRWLPKGVWGQTDFREAFVGDPRKTYASAGCYASVIADVGTRYLENEQKERKVTSAEGVDCYALLAMVEEAPVLAWTTMNLNAPYIAQIWNVDGEELYWLNYEHCVVLTGYDLEKEVFYGTDPLYGPCEYDMKLFLLRFQTMHSQVVQVEKTAP